MASAHWETETPSVSAVENNETIHHFYGFPRPLYEMRYPAPSSPQLAARIAKQLRSAGLACEIDRCRGLDHGAWVPLLLMYPQAGIPVLNFPFRPVSGRRTMSEFGRAPWRRCGKRAS